MSELLPKSVVEMLDEKLQPLFDASENTADTTIARYVNMVACELLIAMDKELITAEVIDDTIQEAIPKGVIASILNEADDPSDPLFTIGRYFDSPDKWYYNLKLAINYYLLSTRKECNPDAAFNLGLIYLNGQSDRQHDYIVGKNYSLAAAYFGFAAYSNRNPGQKCKYLYYLAQMYFYGWGVKQDFSQVLQLAEKGRDYASPITHFGKLNNLAITTMSLLDNFYKNFPEGDDDVAMDVFERIPDEILDKIDVSFSKDFHSANELNVLNSKMAKTEILMSRRVMKCSGEYTLSCPKCGADMVLRISEKANPNHPFPMFLGCCAYPKCNGTFDPF